ncbi:hypothetical protein Tco_0323629 [Tanacetum coccineum]
MYCDNTRAITIANESGITKGARHFHAKVHYLREVIEFGDINLEKVHTYENLADPFTKALAFPKHSEYTRNIGMLPASSFMQVMQSIGFLGPAFFLSQLSHVDSTAMAVFCMACNKFQRPGVQAVISLMAMEIKKHLEKRDDMIKTVSIHDIGFVTFKLSWKWMAKMQSIHKMLRDGIDSWAPKLYLGKVMINSTSLYNKADVTVFNEYPQEDDKHKAQCKVKKCFSIEERDGNVTISVVPEGERKPFIRRKKRMRKGLGEVAISSNSAVTHPQDGPDFMAEDARLLNYPFPYLYDHVSLSQPLWAAIQPNWT